MCNILFIGNEPQVAELTARIIGKYGYNVSYITREDEEFNMDPDLIIFDCDMSPASGLSLYRNVTEKNSRAKILWISPSENDEVSALEAGVDDWMKKPFKIDVLIARLNNLKRQINNK